MNKSPPPSESRNPDIPQSWRQGIWILFDGRGKRSSLWMSSLPRVGQSGACAYWEEGSRRMERGRRMYWDQSGAGAPEGGNATAVS